MHSIIFLFIIRPRLQMIGLGREVRVIERKSLGIERRWMKTSSG